MPLADVQCQPQATSALLKALAAHQVHHAWLFSGPDGVGKELAALGLAQALTCPEKPYVGCGKCSSCVRIAKRNHPDVTWLMPEEEQVKRGLAGRSDFTGTPSKDIRIEQVRRLQERLSLRPLEAPHKLVLIIAAHAMTVQAQNALLKTLEEPPKDTVLVLVSSAQDKLLPTIRSRCTRATFAPLPSDFIAQKLKVLKKLDDEPARIVASMAGGSLARALELDPKRLAERKELIERFEALQPGDARGWLQLAEVMGEDRQTAEAALDVLQVWTRDVARAQVGAGALVNGELSALAVAAAGRVSPGGLQRRVVLLDEAKNAITQRNGAARLQVERMLIELFAA